MIKKLLACTLLLSSTLVLIAGKEQNKFYFTSSKARGRGHKTEEAPVLAQTLPLLRPILPPSPTLLEAHRNLCRFHEKMYQREWKEGSNLRINLVISLQISDCWGKLNFINLTFERFIWEFYDAYQFIFLFLISP